MENRLIHKQKSWATSFSIALIDSFLPHFGHQTLKYAHSPQVDLLYHVTLYPLLCLHVLYRVSFPIPNPEVTPHSQEPTCQLFPGLETSGNSARKLACISHSMQNNCLGGPIYEGAENDGLENQYSKANMTHP
jgi:hypothetical protein